MARGEGVAEAEEEGIRGEGVIEVLERFLGDAEEKPDDPVADADDTLVPLEEGRAYRLLETEESPLTDLALFDAAGVLGLFGGT